MPSPDLVRKALNAAKKRPVDYEFFFNQLKSPDWIEPLLRENLFRHPPAPIKEGDYIKFPLWPESKYLSRMAGLRPDLVIKVISEIPETENVRVHEDLADAALAMPPVFSAQWVQKEIKWLKKQKTLYFSLFPEKLGKLISHLVKGKQAEVAMELAKVLFDVMPDPKKQADSDAETELYFSPDPRARFDLWDYREIVKKDVPDLIKAAGTKALNLFCDLLETAIQFSRRRDEDNGPEDFSYIWRQSIEHDKEHSHGVQNVLVTTVRDASKILIEEKISSLKEILEILEARKWKVFLRLALYLLRTSPDRDSKLVMEYLTNHSFFEDYGIQHEYALLLKQDFNLLSDKEQKIILDWVDKGPDLEKYKDAEQRLSGKHATDEDAEKYKLYWQRHRLTWLRDSLPRDWKVRYTKIIDEIGEGDDSTFPFRTQTGWTGPTSPKSVNDLTQMTVAEIVEFLKTWQAPKGPMESSPEGLGRILSEAVKQQPEKFSTEASLFKNLHPTYVRSLIAGLSDALKEKRLIHWEPVLNLCQWIIEQPRIISEKDAEFVGDCDPNWGWTRSAIGRLLSEGFSEDRIDFEQRNVVWSILEPLTNDPDPTIEHEAKYGGSNMDPATLSINTTRGEAMHTLVRYALWIRRNLEKLPASKERLSRGFEEMPEAKKVFEAHLDILRDPSLAIRAVYGQWLPWLVLLDSSWVQNNLDKIFPKDDLLDSFYRAAWETYVVFCAPYDNAFKIIEKQYERAVDSLANVTEKEKRKSHQNPDTSLAEHLIVFYWRGKLDLDKGVLGKFWLSATPELRGHAIEFIGRTLCEGEDPVPVDIFDRMKVLWEKRLNVAKNKIGSDQHIDEMTAFGWWFASKKLDDVWAVEQLLEVLRISKKVEPDHLVVERLVTLVSLMPEKVVEALRLIVEGQKKEGWGIYSWRENAKVILNAALHTEAQQSAENLIHYLGSLGHFEFGELLSQN